MLPDGRILIVGGAGGANTTELYESATNTISPTGGLKVARSYHTATLLPTGQVLAVGGLGINDWLGSAELYESRDGTWSETGALITARAAHTATLLPDGTVLIAGGASSSGWLASAELYATASATWRATGALTTPPFFPTARSWSQEALVILAGWLVQTCMTPSRAGGRQPGL
jgi:hypothetical protein